MSTETKINLKGLELHELEKLVQQWGQERFRARQLMLWLYHKRATNFDEMTDIAKSFRADLMEKAYISQLKLITKTKSAIDDTVKYLFELQDGNRIESVLMYDQNRVTVCVSTQVGCAQGCVFCATGMMGFARNLTSAEIIDQLMGIEADLGGGKKATNVVFMGMGEPLANYKQTMKALRLMTDPEGLMVAARKITVSTLGLAPKIKAFANDGLKVGLAVSLNATTNEVRNRLMPVNKRYPIEEVLPAAKEWALKIGRRVTIEYVLIRGVNDSPDDAHRLCQILHDVPSKLNLIPFNEIEGSSFQRPEPERVEEFREIAASRYYVVPVRLSRGRDIVAACGQLRTQYRMET
ncbi:TPA: 23S rRNA (adenine(2503)-C(2))-methyltransferase RlmN [Candidatus Poribacteria bacterium]|nr:23S rRNA (adenine(2503)-C(2))-methyltransferase RlmN [Candidatus Poribacteria bacterium]